MSCFPFCRKIIQIHVHFIKSYVFRKILVLFDNRKKVVENNNVRTIELKSKKAAWTEWKIKLSVFNEEIIKSTSNRIFFNLLHVLDQHINTVVTNSQSNLFSRYSFTDLFYMI